MRKIIYVLAIVIVGVSCDTSPNLVNCDFDEKAMLTNYADGIIIPRLEEFTVGLTLLESSVQQFQLTPTIGWLNEVRITYGAVYTLYQEGSFLGFGPGLIGGVSFTERFNTFPTNTISINQNIGSATPVSDSPKSSVGFPALDYLLFSELGTSNDDVLALFTTDPLAAERMSYLLQIATELKTTAQNMEQAWSISGGNYRQDFIDNTGTSEGSSIGMLVNQFNFDFETLKNFKFKIPLGKFNGGVVIPEQVEAYYSGGSRQLALRQAELFKKLFEGTASNGSNGIGLYEYLVCLEAQDIDGNVLAQAISDQFDLIIQRISDVPDPMSESLITSFTEVDNAYLQMQIMVPKIKYEMTTALGVQINYQDNDGD